MTPDSGFGYGVVPYDGCGLSVVNNLAGMLHEMMFALFESNVGCRIICAATSNSKLRFLNISKYLKVLYEYR